MHDIPYPSGKRLLVVEDDSMVAILLSDTLDDGYDVVGPVRTVAEAKHAAEVEQLAGAILDFSLQGENTLALAEALAKRGIPVLFVTSNVAEWLGAEGAAARYLENPLHALNSFELRTAW